MKRTIILLAFIVASAATFAQKGKVTTAQTLKDAGKLDKALEAINAAADASNPDAEKSFNWPKTWQVRGEVYQAIGQTKDENFKKLSTDPLGEAFTSYKKAMELDEKHAIDKAIKMSLVFLTNDLTNQAIQAFQEENYNKALTSFETILEINNLPVIKSDNPNAVDTVVYFNAALAAYNAEKYDVAVNYYKEAAKHGYNGARTYTLMAAAYQMQKDTVNALNTLKTGFEKYPEDNSILESLTQIYLDMKKSEDAMKYLEMAIAKDPTNPRYYYAQGGLYERLGNEQKAIETYKKTMEIDPKFFNAYFNLGVLYYNKGVQQIEVAKVVPANENARYEAELKKADQWFAMALPYMEKCNELQAGDKMVLESLKNLYYRLKQMDKYNAVLEQIEKAK